MTDVELTDEQVVRLAKKTLRQLRRLFVQYKADPADAAAILQMALHRLVRGEFFDGDDRAAALHLAEEFKQMAELAPSDETVN